MNRDEFRCWLDYHAIRYPGVTGWLSAQPDGGATYGLWLKVLETVTQREAQAASDVLFTLEEERQPKGYSAHPRAILALVRSTRRDTSGASRFKEGGWVSLPGGGRVWAYACPHCEDAPSGTVCVWTPQALECYRGNPEAFKDTYAGHWIGTHWCTHYVVIRCCCERGTMGRAVIPQVFDPSVHRKRFIPAGERTSFVDSLIQQQEAALF